jgi:hypothetical protein
MLNVQNVHIMDYNWVMAVPCWIGPIRSAALSNRWRGIHERWQQKTKWFDRGGAEGVVVSKRIFTSHYGQRFGVWYDTPNFPLSFSEYLSGIFRWLSNHSLFPSYEQIKESNIPRSFQVHQTIRAYVWRTSDIGIWTQVTISLSLADCSSCMHHL